jgi:Holliday junction resolvase RusA-like endonuclease
LKSLASVRGIRFTSSKPQESPHGSIVAMFDVDGAAVPWRSPIMGRRHARTPVHVKRWKEKVALAAHDAGYGEARGIAPYEGPVILMVLFVHQHKSKKRWGTPWCKRPDIDNLTKGLADSLTGNVFKKKRHDPPSPIGRILNDDNIVCWLDVQKAYGPTSGVWILIMAVDPAAKLFE